MKTGFLEGSRFILDLKRDTVFLNELFCLNIKIGGTEDFMLPIWTLFMEGRRVRTRTDMKVITRPLV